MPVNLLPWRPQYRRQLLKEFYRTLALVLLLISCGWGVWLGIHVYEIHLKKQKISELQKSIIKNAPAYNGAKNILQQHEQRMRLVKNISNYAQQNTAMFNLVDCVSKLIPDAIYLTSIEKNVDKAYLQGKAPGHSDLAKLLTGINNHYLNQKILIGATNQMNNAQNIVFNLIYDLSAFHE